MLDNTDELAFEVEFLCCVVDKSNDFNIIDCDERFCEFVGIPYSRIEKGDLSLLDLMMPREREDIVRSLCQKDSPYVYADMYLRDNGGNFNYVHCIGRNNEENKLCSLTFADVGKSQEKSKILQDKARTMNNLIDLVTGGVCLFKVNQNMHFEIIYANETCCRFFGTTKKKIAKRAYRIDDLIHPLDKSSAFQAVGKAMATKKPIEMELRILTHKDEYIWCKMDSAIQRYDDDNCPIFHAMFLDITAVKRAEEKADLQREQLEKTFRNLPGPFFMTEYNDPMKLRVVSEDFVKFLGYKRSDIFETYEGNLANIVVAEDVEKVRKAFGKTDKKVLKCNYSIRLKNGNTLAVIDRRKIVESAKGHKSMTCILSDANDNNLDKYFPV